MNENSSVFSFFTDCVTPRPNGKICDSCTTGKMFKVYRSWCRNNNHGFAETEKDFRAKISKLMGGTFSDVTVKRNGYSYYRDYTLTLDAKQDYSSVYGYDSAC